MYKQIMTLGVAGLLLSACGESPSNSEQTTEEATKQDQAMVATGSSADLGSMTDAEKRAYALGANSAGFLARSFPEFDSWGMSIDREIVKQGFNDMLEDKAALTTEEMQAILMNLQQEIQEKVAEIEKEQSEKSAVANIAFLNGNLENEGVIATESGLQYRILAEGTGANPTPDDTVRVHYKGMLINGSEFDSSYTRGAPIDFPLGKVIPGWVEGIQLVKEGGKIELVMGPELGYGAQATPTIPANSVLIFEVELLKINPEPEPEMSAEETDTEK